MSGLVEILAEDRITSMEHFREKFGASYLDHFRYMGDYDTELYRYCNDRKTHEQDFWIVREFFRTRANTKSGYRSLENVVKLPKTDLERKLLFPHGAIRDALKIAFTPTAEYGRSDRQVVTTLGKFLTKYYADVFTPAQIRDFTTAWRDYHGTDDVLWARTSDEIERVYMNSAVHSCMTHKIEEGVYRSGSTMPVRAYGGGETPVAYLWREGRAMSRTLVNEPDKHWVRIYGDDLLRVKLEGLGYTQGSLEGARILKIPHTGGWVVPYIDGNAQCVSEIPGDDKHLMVDSSGYCTSANGYVHLDGERGESEEVACHECEDAIDPDDSTFSRSYDAHICDSCRDNNWVEAVTRVGGTCDHDWMREEVCSYWDGIDQWVTDNHRAYVFSRRGWVVLSEQFYAGSAAPEADTTTTAEGEVIYDCDAVTCSDGDIHHIDHVVVIGEVRIHKDDDLSRFYISTLEGSVASLLFEDDVEDDGEESVECIRVHAWLFWMLCFMTREQVDQVIRNRFSNDAAAYGLFKQALDDELSENAMLREGPPQHNLFMEAA